MEVLDREIKTVFNGKTTTINGCKLATSWFGRDIHSMGGRDFSRDFYELEPGFFGM